MQKCPKSEKKLIAKRKKTTTTTIVQVVYVEWKLFGSLRDDPSQKVPPDNTAPFAPQCSPSSNYLVGILGVSSYVVG